MSTDLASHLHREMVRSYLGPAAHVAAFTDGRGTIASYAFIAGYVVPHGVFCAILANALHETSARMADKVFFNNRLLDLWGNLDLGEDLIKQVRFHEPTHAVKRAVRGSLMAIAAQREGTPSEKVRRYVEEIARSHAEALDAPVRVSGRLDALDGPTDAAWVADMRVFASEQMERASSLRAVFPRATFAP